MYLPRTASRRVASAVTNVTVKLLFNYRREDFAYYAIFRSALLLRRRAGGRGVAVRCQAEAGIRPKFSILFAPLTLDRRDGSGTFNLDKIAPFYICREEYRKPHVSLRMAGIATRSRIEVILLPCRAITIVCVYTCVFNHGGSRWKKEVARKKNRQRSYRMGKTCILNKISIENVEDYLIRCLARYILLRFSILNAIFS